MEEEKEGMSLLDILRIILSKKLLGIVVAVAVAFVCAVFMYFGLNPGREKYQSSFSIDFPGSNAVSPVYPDNSPFNYREMVSLSKLNEVKNSDEKFASLDVENMFYKNDISITRTSAEVAGELEFTYVLSAKASYFDDAAQASAFFDGLANIPVNYVRGLASGDNGYLLQYNDAKFYDDKIELLSSQANYIGGKLDALAGMSGGAVLSECRQLQTRLDFFGDKLDEAAGSMLENLYVHNAQEVKDTYSSRLTALNVEAESKKREAGIIFGRINSGDATVDLTQASARIEALASEIAQLERKIETYNKYIEGDCVESADFAATLAGLNSEITEITQKYEANLQSYYTLSSFVSYETSISSEGGFGLLITLLISVVLGVIVGAIVAFIAGYRRTLKPAQVNAGEVESTLAPEPAEDGSAPKEDVNSDGDIK